MDLTTKGYNGFNNQRLQYRDGKQHPERSEGVAIGEGSWAQDRILARLFTILQDFHPQQWVPNCLAHQNDLGNLKNKSGLCSGRSNQNLTSLI